MICYQYDGTFEGLLTVFTLAAEESREIGNITSNCEFQADLFTEIHPITTDTAVAADFFHSLQKNFSKTVLLEIGYCFLSEKTGFEKLLLDYMERLMKYGLRVQKNLADPVVFQVRRLCDQVDHEILRMQGFIRFRELVNQVFYAPITPDHNIIQLLAPHFKARFADQKWLIHDTRRQTGIYYNGTHVKFIPFMEMSGELHSVMKPFSSLRNSALLDKEEVMYQKIWDQYFQKIAISERQNKRQQRQRMPERYWRYLVENVQR